jgi:hypothetical protein
MAHSKGKRPARLRRPIETVSVSLSLDEVATLVLLASYYGRTLGSVRRMIQLVSPGEMRAKARFVQEETYWLRRFAEAQRDRMSSLEAGESTVEFTPRSLVAFYGRTLASLNVPRRRRRLSPAKIEAREALAEKFRTALEALRSSDGSVLEEELQTRRLRERQWITEALSLQTVAEGG